MGNNINTKLWDAARDGDEATVRQCIEAGATVDWRDEDGWTALHQAAKYGHSTVVRLLMNAGWSLWARNNHGRTPLSYIDTKLWDAARDGEEATVRQCIEAGATVDWRRDGVTALHWATKYGHTNVARLLVDAGWSRGARNNDGNTPQDYTDLKLCNAARDGDEATVRQYLEAGATVDWRVAGDWTALHRAAWGGHTDVARLLVDAGWSLEGRAYAGWTPLTCAAEEAQLETVKYLLLQGAQINTQDDAEWTPLHWASYLGHTEVVRLLLMSGASEKIKSKGRRGILSSGSCKE